MAIHLQNGNNVAEVLKGLSIQSLPFKISADCEAKVSSYFVPFVKTIKDNDCTASFRGFPLLGRKIQLPNGYMGVILNEVIKPNIENEDRNFYVSKKFNSFVHWNWDKFPDNTDAIIQVFNEWVDVAEALHAPITEN